MLRCFAGICSSPVAAAEERPAERRPVVKPIFRLDEEENSNSSKAASLQELAARVGFEAAPPGAAEPVAIVSRKFQNNSARLLVVVPSLGEAGVWDATLGRQGALPPLLHWAEANSYEVAVFKPEALKAEPATTWDRVLKGSPAGCVSVIVAAGMLQYVEAALLPVHPLLFTRLRTFCVRGEDAMSNFSKLPGELQRHLTGAVATLPASWEQLEAQVSFQVLFELLQERDEEFQNLEALKYSGFQTLKENDMPGLKRMGMEQRIKRLDRDRDNDELARLLKKHDKASGRIVGGHESEDEPGID